jgi:hypothetical protein
MIDDCLLEPWSPWSRNALSRMLGFVLDDNIPSTVELYECFLSPDEWALSIYIFHATSTTTSTTASGSKSNPKHCWSIDIVLFPWTVDLQTTATSTVDPVQTRRFASSASGPSEGQGRRSPLCRGGLIISKGSSTRGWVLPISEVISKLAFVSHTANNYRAMLIWSK